MACCATVSHAEDLLAAMRIGQGFDIHALVEGRKLIIGGVTIPYARGLLGHSDADVLLHAICDALIGAAALGDIGQHFPDTDPRYAGIDSRKLLREVSQLLCARDYKIVNIDTTVIAQAPKLAPFISAMRENIAADAGVAVDAVNVKAKTAERLGAVGRGEGIAAEAVVLIAKIREGASGD
jgi:2-C-methyl-D-erythritol 2,4-cyclodiphosphate synthase